MSGEVHRILMAFVGGMEGAGKPCGLLAEGFAVPLAATEWAGEVVGAVGESGVAEWLAALGVESPPAGGLWVAELGELEEDPEEPEGYGVEDVTWRRPTAEELEGLLARQMARAVREKADRPPSAARWTWLGAIV